MSEQSERVLSLVGEKPEIGHILLNEVRAFVSRFCVFPNEHSLNAVTLWAAHAHMIEHFFITPRLTLLSPEPQSGKTRVLEILNLLVPDSMFVFNATPATIFRTLANRQITLLFDEIDTIWSSRGRDESHEELRALLNAGYKRGATIPRCVGNNHEVQFFTAYAAVALAGIETKNLPDTIRSRSVIIHMRRRMREEKVDGFNIRRHENIGHLLRDRLAAWGNQVGERVGDAYPKMPPGVEDRNEEIWSPLLAVADAAGGEWPQIARDACTELIKSATDHSVSLGIRLLGDLRTLFQDYDKMSTAMLLDLLTSENSGLEDDAPWSDLYGKPINARKLAELLRPYGIKSRKVKIDGISLQGYRREDLWDSWQRWLPTPEEAEPVEPTEPTSKNRHEINSVGNGAWVPANDAVPELNTPKTEPLWANSEEFCGPVPEVPEVPDFRR